MNEIIMYFKFKNLIRNKKNFFKRMKYFKKYRIIQTLKFNGKKYLKTDPSIKNLSTFHWRKFFEINLILNEERMKRNDLIRYQY